MDTSFWLAQVFGIIALILVCISYCYNNKKSFLFYQILGNCFYSASFLSLGVLVGGFNTIISTIRVIVLYFYERNKKDPSKILFFLFFTSYLINGIFSFQNYLDIIAIISYEIFNIAMFIKNISLVRKMMILPNLMIIIYNILNFTYTNALLDFIEIAVLSISIYKFDFQDIKKIKYLL